MVRTLLIRGMLIGLLAGFLVFTFARVFGEPQVDRAISFESAMDDAKAKADEARGIKVEPEPELVSRPTQAGLGLFTGVMVYCDGVRRPLRPGLRRCPRPRRID